MILAYSFSDYMIAIAVVALGMAPFAVSIWALLDVAKRPGWAWALANRDRTNWIAMVAFTSVIFVVGITVSGYYLIKIRPQIAAVEGGNIAL